MTELTLTTETGETLPARLIPNTGNKYAASADGQIFRLREGKPPRRLRQQTINGYRKVTVNSKSQPVHRLMCEAYHGPAPQPPMDVAHWNGNRADNRPENLRWATRAENINDQLRHGTHWSQRGRKGRSLRWHIELRDSTKAWQQFQAKWKAEHGQG